MDYSKYESPCDMLEEFTDFETVKHHIIQYLKQDPKEIIAKCNDKYIPYFLIEDTGLPTEHKYELIFEIFILLIELGKISELSLDYRYRLMSDLLNNDIEESKVINFLDSFFDGSVSNQCFIEYFFRNGKHNPDKIKNLEIFKYTVRYVNDRLHTFWNTLILSDGEDKHKLIKILLDDGILDVNGRSSFSNLTFMMMEIYHMSDDIFKLLLEKTDIELENIYGDTLLLHSRKAKINKFEKIKMLVERGANINHQNHEGDSILTFISDPEIIRYLVDHGADINLCDKKGVPFFEKISLNCPDIKIIKVLVNAGMDINYKNKHGENFLIIFSKQRKTNILKDLVKIGADVNVYDRDGNSTLHFIGNYYDDLDFLKLVLKKGLDINHRNNEGKSILDMISPVSLAKRNLDLFFNILFEHGLDNKIIQESAIRGDNVRSSVIRLSYENYCLKKENEKLKFIEESMKDHPDFENIINLKKHFDELKNKL